MAGVQRVGLAAVEILIGHKKELPDPEGVGQMDTGQMAFTYCFDDDCRVWLSLAQRALSLH